MSDHKTQTTTNPGASGNAKDDESFLDAGIGGKTGRADLPTGANCCQRCGEEDFLPNIEAWEIYDQLVCDMCAEEVFEENGQFGVGA